MNNNTNLKDNIILKCNNLVKTYYDGKVPTNVLKGISINIKDGEFVAMMGRSGAGKSTCLYQLALLDTPTDGEIIIEGENTHNMDEDERSRFRLYRFGYVFQNYSLMTDLTAIENIILPLLQQGVNIKDAIKKGEIILEKIGLSHRRNNLPSDLSGGEQQRVAIGRAIIHDPKIIFADEPTANLDSISSKNIINLFKQLNKEGKTVIMVTHEDEYKSIVDRVITIHDGQVV
ncbi:MAG: ABC transporter ATP-binding protein [Cyanobium sp. MAG06]|nr:ABC transporter ATP-binding protein [Cyanobium sp. MAG06]